MRNSIRWSRQWLGLLAVLGMLVLSNAARAEEFSYENLLFTWLKLDPNLDYDETGKCYLEVYRNQTWNNVANDEFRRQKAIQESIELLRKRIGNTNAHPEMDINTIGKFGDYDFKRHQFDFRPLSSTTYFYKETRSGYTSCFPRTIKVKFSNPDLINGLPMDENAAQAFLDSRKSYYGDVDREVNLAIQFQVEKRDGKILIGHITKAVVSDEKTGHVLKTFTAQALSGAEMAAAQPKPFAKVESLSVLGMHAGGQLTAMRSNLPPGSISCNSGGSECEILLLQDPLKVIKAKVDAATQNVTSLSYWVPTTQQSVNAVADSYMQRYGRAAGDSNQEPKAGGFTQYGSVPSKRGVRTLKWVEGAETLFVQIYYGLGKPLQIRETIQQS